MAELKKALTEKDYKKLYALASALGGATRSTKAAVLLDGLRDALIFTDEEIAPGVVTMHSLAKLVDLESGDEYAYRLVFPSEADIDRGLLSVVTPLGSALIGRREGESFEYDSPGGKFSVRVAAVEFQPENGDA